MAGNIKDKQFKVQEAVAYYIIGYKKYEQNEEQNGLKDVIKNILNTAEENINNKEITGVDIEKLNKIDFYWKLSGNDFVSYATCIFYVLLNREIQITEEKIITEFIATMHTHHPRNVIQEAEIILTRTFPELK